MPYSDEGFEPVQPLPADLDPDVAYWLEMAEAHANRSTCESIAEQPGNPAGASAMVLANGAVAFGMTAIDFFLFNRVVGLGVGHPATRDEVEQALGFYERLGLRQIGMHVAPGARPDELPRWLADAGFVLGSRWVKMWHDLREIAPQPDGLPIERVDASSREAFGDVLMAAFEMPDPVRPVATATVGRPGWHHYLGSRDGAAVAVAAMRVDDGVAWLGNGGTLPETRGRGWQTAMLLRRLHDARTLGCRLAVTETGEESERDPVNHSYRNMVRTGFRLGYARRNWYRG